MTALSEFAYAQARLQARHGAMAGPVTWQSLEASRTSGHFLELARSGPLSRWVDGVDGRADAHRIERQLRVGWRRVVADVARWPPARWQAAVRWFDVLPELPLLDGARRDATVAAWLRGDARLAAISDAPSPAAAFARRGAGLDVLTTSSMEAHDLAVRWLAAWRRRWPRDAGDAALLCRPVELLMPHLRGDGGAARGVDATPVRQALVRLFRQHAASALAVFAHLALLALEFERLRGGLLVRVLFEPGREPLVA